MTQTPGWLLPGFLTLVGLFAGILSNRWWTRREANARRSKLVKKASSKSTLKKP
jgi:hypothetical protein